jgi:phage-related baseplate assembly protein
MSLALPNLDDRTFDDLMEEARSLLVTYAPDLTNHNPSDPLITLLELFAYFIEIQLYRVNLVTDDSRRVFLRLLNGPDESDEPGGPPSATAATPAEPEDLDAEVRRTVLKLRRVERAVTPADFEFLALNADPRVARARCHPNVNLESADPAERLAPRPGHVSVVIVPALNASTVELKTIVTDVLERRRLLGTRVHVVGPRLVPLTVRVTLNLLPGADADAVKTRAAAALKAHFDPFVGRGGAGWPLGRDVYVSEIYRLLDGLAGVDFVTRTGSADGQRMLDELQTSDRPNDRFTRNAQNELVSCTLLGDELADVTADIQTELPDT